MSSPSPTRSSLSRPFLRSAFHAIDHRHGRLMRHVSATSAGQYRNQTVNSAKDSAATSGSMRRWSVRVAPRYNREVDPARPNLFGLGRPELTDLVTSLGEPAYRAGQIHLWLYRRRVTSIAEMTDLTKGLRDRIAATHDLRWPAVAERGTSQDGTIKYLFRLDDGATVESVYIPEERRRTICISTQAGCPLKCAF